MKHPSLHLRASPLPSRHLIVRHQPRVLITPQIRCDARSDKGKKIDQRRIEVGSPCGEGSFGQVFQVRIAYAVFTLEADNQIESPSFNGRSLSLYEKDHFTALKLITL